VKESVRLDQLHPLLPSSYSQQFMLIFKHVSTAEFASFVTSRGLEKSD